MDDIRIHREGVKKIWFLIDEIELANQPISDVRGEISNGYFFFNLSVNINGHQLDFKLFADIS